MGAEVGGQTPIAIVRTTANIRAESVPRPASRRGKPHMLVIWGEDPGLDMARDRTLLRSTRLCLTPQILAATALKPSPISSNVSVTPLLTPRGGEPPCSVCCPPVARRSPLLSTPNPIDRRYLASLVAALGQQGATVIGIDYLSELRYVREGRTP